MFADGRDGTHKWYMFDACIITASRLLSVAARLAAQAVRPPYPTPPRADDAASFGDRGCSPGAELARTPLSRAASSKLAGMLCESAAFDLQRNGLTTRRRGREETGNGEGVQEPT